VPHSPTGLFPLNVGRLRSNLGELFTSTLPPPFLPSLLPRSTFLSVSFFDWWPSLSHPPSTGSKVDNVLPSQKPVVFFPSCKGGFSRAASMPAENLALPPSNKFIFLFLFSPLQPAPLFFEPLHFCPGLIPLFFFLVTPFFFPPIPIQVNFSFAARPFPMPRSELGGFLTRLPPPSFST